MTATFGNFVTAKDRVLSNISNVPTQPNQWEFLGSKDISSISKERIYKADVAVIGGGISGVCAAVSAARNGAKVIFVQNRPVLGGNASSEVHVPICGSYHFVNDFKVDRETGIVEELQLENRYYNEQMSWEVWDHILYDYVTREKNITLLLNTHAQRAEMSGNKIQRAICYQQSTESTIIIEAEIFIDSSGDGQLAVSAGAKYRSGREGKAEFGEKYAPDQPDGWVMGDSIQFSSKNMGRPIEFRPPSFAVKFDPSKMNKRKIGSLSCGFWWVEFGSDLDITADTETNRDKLLAYLYGAWDYVKNSGKYPESANLALDWVGSVPGRRESRRFMGDHIITETDLTEYRHFEDTVAYAGGWSLDEHCPGGLLNEKDPGSFFHQRFKKMTEIPFRALYSCNVENLMFAGRNLSASHIALSGLRLIAMGGLMGQAVGTASSLCVKNKITPREVYQKHMDELQEQLLRDDAYIPYRPANDKEDLARKATLSASSTSSGDVKLLVDGYSRDGVDAAHHWQSSGVKSSVTLSWDKPVSLSTIEVKCNTNLQREIEIHPNKDKQKLQSVGMPAEMVKKISVELYKNGVWQEVAQVDNNRRRLIRLPFDTIKSDRVRVNILESYGDQNVKLFEVRCY